MSGGLQFVGFMNKSLVLLILPILRSRFAIDFLRELTQIVAMDVVMCFMLFGFSAVHHLLGFLKNFLLEEQLFETVLILANQVLSSACDRQNFNYFFGLFKKKFSFCGFRLLFR
jgi:hypothetical protein